MQTNIYDARSTQCVLYTHTHTFRLRTAQMFSSHGNITSAENSMQNYPV